MPIVGRTATADEGLVLILVLVAGTLTTGLVLLLLGIFKMGRWIRFVPFPVIAGFMAASGWFLAVGGLHVLAGSAWSWRSLWQVVVGQHVLQLETALLRKQLAEAVKTGSLKREGVARSTRYFVA